MGIIQRQGLKHTIVSYTGVALGIISTFIYANVTELYGLYTLLHGSTMLCIAVFMLGFNVHAVRFFPNFKNKENGHNGFLGFLLTGGIVGFLLFLLLFPAVKYLLLDLLFAKNENKELFSQYIYYLIPLVFLYIFNYLFFKYISNFHRIVVPNILEQLLIKIILPVITLLYIGGYFTTTMFVQGVLANYILVFLGLILYTNYLGELYIKPNYKFIDKSLAKEIRDYSFFGLLNSLGSQVAFRIDTLMVAGMLSISSGGIYAITNVITDVIVKPAKAIVAISAPIISKSWATNDMKEIELIYKKSSIILLIIGWYTFLGVWGSIDDLFNILPNSEEISLGKYVIFFLGLAKIIDLATSVNNEIIGYSPQFRFNFYSLLILAVLNVVLNLFLIPMFENGMIMSGNGMIGSALATFISITTFNLSKLTFIWYKFKMQPFSKATLKILAIVTISWGVIHFLPIDFTSLNNLIVRSIVNILVRSIIFTIIFGGLILTFNISPDVNNMVNKGLNKIKSFFK